MATLSASQHDSSIVVPKPSPQNGLAARLIDALEKVFVWAFYPDISKPRHFLEGNFGPVAEFDPVPDLPVEGTLPSCFNGEFVRIGPNPKYKPVAGYHWFDGDGMIHALRMKDGKATYASRFVQTSRLKQESFFGAAKFDKFGAMKGVFGLLIWQIFRLRSKFKVLDLSQGTGTGNTAMTYHNGKLLALQETDKPYVIRVFEDGDLQTLGFLDYEKRLNHPFTAHPKVDPVTGELFTFGYQIESPYCIYRVISKDGVMHDAVPITISGPVMMHDFAITEHYAIFLDVPLYFNPKEMVKGELIFKFDNTKPAKIGVLPRYAENEAAIKWFELPTCYVFHNANAWEEEDEVVLYSCRIPDLDFEMFSGPVRERYPLLQDELYEMRLNLSTGKASQRQLSLPSVDFPRINQKYTGRKQQFVYCVTQDDSMKVTGLVKFDLWVEPAFEGQSKIEVGGNVKGMITFAPGRYGSEAIFVPRSPGEDEAEDDGYLICFIYDEGTGKSEVCVYDAKTMALDPVAVVKLPCRVPYGFHAFFVSEEQLQSQK